MSNTTPPDIAKARAALVLDSPFFATLALQMPADFDEECETCWTDGKRVGINPEWWAKLDLKEQSHSLAHLAMHCGLEHHIRRGQRDEKAWNDAADYPTNRILADAGFSNAAGGYMAPKGCDKIAEDWYNDTKGDDDGQGQGQGPPPPGAAPGAGQPQGQPGSGEVRDMPGSGPDGQATKAEKAAEASGQQQRLAEAANVAKAMGNLPAGLQRLVEEALEPTVDWRDALHEFAGEWTRDEYTWQRPNRRFIDQDLYLPSMRNETLGQIVVAIDTSGSICDRELAAFAGELSGILETFSGMSAIVIYCDTQVYPEATKTYTPDDLPITLEPAGGGGTRFSPVFAEVERMALEPRAMVFFTDLCCSDYPDSEPAYPVLWAKRSGGWGGATTPPFGRVVDINLNKEA